MALDISNKINEATNDVILQGKDIRNRIVSSENEIKHHMNDAEMCILEAIEGLGERIVNNGGGSGDTITNAVLEKDIIADVTIGGIPEGATIEAGTTFTAFVERLFTVIKAGTISNPTMSGYAEISKPIIKVSILEQDGTYSSISSGDVIKENSKIKIEIEIPTSEAKNTDAKIVKTTTVLAQGYIRKKDDNVDIPNGIGDCEIGTEVVSEGNDYVDIVSNNGCFSSFDITDGTTKITGILSDVNSDGSLQVKSVSKTYKVLSDSNYVVYAKSNKEETLEEIANKPNRVKTINKDSQIGVNLSDTKNSDIFTIKIETWGVLPELTTTGNVTINAPIITVTKSKGEIVNPGDKLSPNDEITVNVSLNGNSTISGNSASLIKSTDSEFEYGWEKIINGEQTELVKDPNNNQKCMIGCKLSDDVDILDTLLFVPNTKLGIFETMQIDTDKNEINFGPIRVDSNLSNNSFSVQAKSGIHKILSDANYQINALSSIYSTGKNNSETNCLTISENEILKTFNSELSAVSSFNFNLLAEKWITMPDIVRTGGAVSFGNPTIKVTTKNGTVYKEGDTPVLDPSDELDIEITLPKSTISSASYNVDVSGLTYGWKLHQNNNDTFGGPTDPCDNIELTIDGTNANDVHSVTGSGSLAGLLDTTTLKKTGVPVGTGGTLTVSSTHAKYTIRPTDSNCKIYSLSSYNNTTDTDSRYYKIPPYETINGTTKTVTFNYTVKAATYSSFYAWDVKDFMPIFNLLNELNGNASDEDIISTGLTKYTGVVSGGKLNNGYVVAFSKTTPKLYNETGAPISNSDWLEIDNNYPGSRKLYVFPSGDPSNVVWKNLTINE